MGLKKKTPCRVFTTVFIVKTFRLRTYPSIGREKFKTTECSPKFVFINSFRSEVCYGCRGGCGEGYSQEFNCNQYKYLFVCYLFERAKNRITIRIRVNAITITR